MKTLWRFLISMFRGYTAGMLNEKCVGSKHVFTPGFNDCVCRKTERRLK